MQDRDIEKIIQGHLLKVTMGDEELHASGELHLIVASSPSKDRNCEALKVFPPARSVQIFSLLQRNVEETSVLQGTILAGEN